MSLSPHPASYFILSLELLVLIPSVSPHGFHLLPCVCLSLSDSERLLMKSGVSGGLQSDAPQTLDLTVINIFLPDGVLPVCHYRFHIALLLKYFSHALDSKHNQCKVIPLPWRRGSHSPIPSSGLDNVFLPVWHYNGVTLLL